MNTADLFQRYQELQTYVDWQPCDAEIVHALAGLLEPALGGLIDDFYDEIGRHPNARKVITGGQAQITRLKGTLLAWLRELLAGKYDSDYVARRWRVGGRHVEIGLDQVYTNVALSRLRSGLIQALQERWPGDAETRKATVRALNKLLDLDLAIIEDAYQAAYVDRQQRTERLAAIGQVAGGVAHELRNPLNVVKTSIYYLLNARQLTLERTAEHLRRMEKHVTVADNVITALSNFARMPVPNLGPLGIESCVREVLELNPLPALVQVTVDCPPDLPPAFADRDQLRIVLGNLIRNAGEAMPHGGRLTITGRAEDNHIDIAVTDSGTGIPPENLARIMEPLFSTKARGLGLGLAMARAILDKNKASLLVASTLGQGSTFTVRLPAAGGQGSGVRSQESRPLTPDSWPLTPDH